jgi:hypothetical protein
MEPVEDETTDAPAPDETTDEGENTPAEAEPAP